MTQQGARWQILEGDVRERLGDLDDGSVQTCITSPAYWGLRDYGTEGQLGLESTPEEYVANLVAVFGEVRRVLRDDGTLWLNLGDSYAGSWSGNSMRPGGGTQRPINGEMLTPVHDGRYGDTTASNTGVVPPGLKPKDLCGIPWRVAFALQADGWWLRSDIVWAKPNPMPESVTDRPTRSHEYIFLLSKSARYFYNAEAIREDQAGDWGERVRQGPLYEGTVGPQSGHAGLRGKPKRDKQREIGAQRAAMQGGDRSSGFNERWDEARANGTAPLQRNKRSVWTVATQPYAEAHFATFPPKLIEPCVLAGSAPGDTILDPFAGSGTSGLVALRHNRSFVGIELNPTYCEMARNRIRDDAPLWNAGMEVVA